MNKTEADELDAAMKERTVKMQMGERLHAEYDHQLGGYVSEGQTYNTSGLEPLGEAVLVQNHMPERKKGMIEIPEQVALRTDMVEQRARVIAIGQTAWKDEPVPRCKVGDLVLVSKFAGYLARGADGLSYRIVNGRDVFCKIVKEAAL